MIEYIVMLVFFSLMATNFVLLLFMSQDVNHLEKENRKVLTKLIEEHDRMTRLTLSIARIMNIHPQIIKKEANDTPGIIKYLQDMQHEENN